MAWTTKGSGRAQLDRPVAMRDGVPPLTAAALRDLALRYVGRFATSEAKLRRYLQRKLFERGWDGDGPPPVDAVVARVAELGYVDDRSFAEGRARSLGGRGYGARRVAADLGAAGIARDLASEVAAAGDAFAAALAFARRRRLGPYGPDGDDPDRRRKAFAAMMRAGHAPGDARRVLAGQVADDDGGA